MLPRLHAVLWSTSGYVQLAASAFAWGLIEARMRLTDSHTYRFLLWNLFLAWVPYVCAASMAASRGRGARWMLAAVWLAFFPNAPYLITDFVHFRTFTSFPWWYDVGMLASFACIGLMLALMSLRLVHRQVEDSRGVGAGWAFVIGVCVLSAFGIYLGRFLRLNSWEVVSDLNGVLADLRSVFVTPALWPRALGMTTLFTGIQLLCYIPFTQSGRPLPRP